MFRPSRPQIPHMRWSYPPPSPSPQWRYRFGPPPPFDAKHQRFNHPRPPFQSGNNNFWCETCDRGFATEDILNKHKQQHQKCNIDGCEFIAHPKVITKHIQMQHSTGLYKKIANLKNPEEIAKWREERRKRYPTKTNIEKKTAELKEKIERGEKMGLQRDRGYLNKPNSEQNNRQGYGIKRKFNSRNENHPKSKFKKVYSPNNKHDKNAPPKAKSGLVVAENNRLKPFTGIINLQMDSDNEVENDVEELDGLIEDDDDCLESSSVNVQKVDEHTKPVMCGALTSLMCDYGSSEEEENKIENYEVVESQDIHNRKRNLLQKSNPTKQVTSRYNSLIIEHDPKQKETSIDMKKPIPYQSERKEDKTLVRNKIEVNKNLVDSESNTTTFVEKEVIQNSYDNRSEDDKLKRDLFQDRIVNENDSDSGPEEVKVEVSTGDNISTMVPEDSIKEVRKTVNKGRLQVNQRRRLKIPSTLLQKLLHKEIQQERNIILQCVRYIRKNNYFDKKE